MNAEGDHARVWIADLGHTAMRYTSELDLEIEEPLAGGSMAVVLAAIKRRTGEKVVTKFQPPWHDNLQYQAAALETWNGECAPKLLDVSDDYRILTMERIMPGESSPLHPAQAAEIIAEYSAYKSDIIQPFIHTTVMDRFTRALENRNNIVAHSTYTAALGLVSILATSSGDKTGLLHGDFSDNNVLKRGDKRVVIDPIPVFGDIAYDAAKWAIGQSTNINERCRKISKHLDIDEERTILWAHGLAVAEVGLSSRPRARSTIISLGHYARRAGFKDIDSYLHACAIATIPTTISRYP